MKIQARGYPYRQRKDIADDLGMSRSTIYQRCKELEEFQDRYGEFAVIHDGNMILINILAFLDFMRYRSSLMGKNTKKYVPPWNPEQIAKQMGWTEGGRV